MAFPDSSYCSYIQASLYTGNFKKNDPGHHHKEKALASRPAELKLWCHQKQGDSTLYSSPFTSVFQRCRKLLSYIDI